MSNPDSSEESLYLAACRLTDPTERVAFLDVQCGGQAELRRRLDGLLAAREDADAFFDQAPAARLRERGDAIPCQPSPGPASEDGHDSRSFRRCSFSATNWSLILAAKDSQSPTAAPALEQLCRKYWYPLYAYVRRRGYAEADAQDLTQGFFALLLERYAVERLVPWTRLETPTPAVSTSWSCLPT
jgi:hypothetical protein